MVSQVIDRGGYWKRYYKLNRVKSKAKVRAWRKKNADRLVAYDRIRCLKRKRRLCLHERRELEQLLTIWKITGRPA